jgi:hypothetical protein
MAAVVAGSVAAGIWNLSACGSGTSIPWLRIHSANLTSPWNSWVWVNVVGEEAEWLGKLATLGLRWPDEQAQMVIIASASHAVAAARPLMPRGGVTAFLLVLAGRGCLPLGQLYETGRNQAVSERFMLALHMLEQH